MEEGEDPEPFLLKAETDRPLVDSVYLQCETAVPFTHRVHVFNPRATPKATQSDMEVADLSRTPGVPRSGVASSLGVSRRATSVIVRPVARLGPDGHVGVLAHTNVELLGTRRR